MISVNPKIHMVGQYFKICEKEKNEIMNEKFGELFNNYQIIQTHKVECYPNGEYVPRKKKINSSSSFPSPSLTFTPPSWKTRKVIKNLLKMTSMMMTIIIMTITCFTVVYTQYIFI